MKDGQTIAQWLKWDFEANGDLKIRDKNENLIYGEKSDGFWAKREWGSQGLELYYYENSNGVIKDNRIPQTMTYNGRKYQLIP